MITSTHKLKARYKAGDRVRVKVVEHVGDQAWIVSLEGMLLQIKNRSRRPFYLGEYIVVEVQSTDPAILNLV